ncbi:MAG: hypothetical protein COV75_01895 [Candidatus Omnitrophica bacterium CG11_big_fil_rev_8_21_14_0_20_63_9]|nr:MAG: hypothetical protein COV75_01895 [Candidatus Omnitrophica bacterium CG11_big_fil_rev_8_21_14_0_20_63_9]
MNVRPELAQHLQQRLRAFSEGFRHNLALIGPVGSGKTFQLQRLVMEPPPGLTMIYCPMYRESPRTFLERFGCAILQAGAATMLQRLGGQLPSLATVLPQARQELPRTAAAVGVAATLLPRRLYAEALTRMLDAIPMLTEECGRPSVLILDEFLLLEDLGFVHAFHELGKRVMTWPSTLFMLSSSSCFRARNILRERLQLLFGQFELLTLETLELQTATAWVQAELRGIKGANSVTPFLMRWLGGYPWYLAVILNRLKERAAMARRPTPLDALWSDAVWDVLGSPQGPLHQWCSSRTEGLTRLRGGPRAFEVLLQVAEGARTATAIGAAVGRAGVSTTLQLLLEQDLVQRNGMCWHVTDPLLRCWLSTLLGARRSGAPVDERQLRERLEAYLRGLWARWQQSDQLSFAEQVVGLFGRFCEDTILLDAKTGRLPKFDTIHTQPADHSPSATYVVADSPGRRWCAAVQEGAVDESAIAQFESFCRTQTPRPSRKVVVTNTELDPTTRVMAKAASMWVWQADDINLLMELYASDSQPAR